jgi:hypothetical protein
MSGIFAAKVGAPQKYFDRLGQVVRRQVPTVGVKRLLVVNQLIIGHYQNVTIAPGINGAATLMGD